MKRAAVLAGLAVLSVTLCAQPGLTQPSDELKALRRDFETLKEGQTTIQKELQEIKNLAARDRAPQARPRLPPHR